MSADVSRGKVYRQASCEDCPESRGDGDVRGWARRHCEKMGHVVYVLTEHGSYFRPVPVPTATEED